MLLGAAMLRTTPFVLKAGNLTINASVIGDLRVGLLNEDGSPIEGFNATDCQRIQGDSLAHAPQWKQPIASLRDRTVQLLITATEAKLYAFDLT